MTQFVASFLKKSQHCFQRLFLWVGVLALAFLPLSAKSDNGNSESFKITTDTLEQLKTDLPRTIVSALNPFLNELFTSKAAFLKTLNGLENPSLQAEQVELILQHSLLDNLWIDFDKADVDFQTGESVLTGNVTGGIPKENITFSADRVRIVTEGPRRFNRIVIESNVQIEQPGRKITTDWATYNRETQTMNLMGSIKMEEEGMNLSAAKAILNRPEEKTEVRGKTNPHQRVRVEYAAQTIQGSERFLNAQPSVVQAQRALLENTKQRVTFEGNVEMTRPQQGLYLSGGKVRLFFDENQQLIESIAEQEVCIEQPGRAAKADRAEINEPQQTILLEGDAKMSKNGFYLAGPTINLFLDVEKGEAIGDSNTSVKMVIPLGDESNQSTAADQRFTCQ